MSFEGYVPGRKEFSLKLFDEWTQSPSCRISMVAKDEFERLRTHLDRSSMEPHEIVYGMQMTLGELMMDYTFDARLEGSFDDDSAWNIMHHKMNSIFFSRRNC